MSNGELLLEIRRILTEEEEVPSKASQRLVLAALVEVYRKLNKVEAYTKNIDERQSKVDRCIESIVKRLDEVEKKIDETSSNKARDLKWALEKVGLPVIMLLLGIILAHIFGG